MAQGGEFVIHMDGDLFKVVLKFSEYTESVKPDGEKEMDVLVKPEE